MSETHDDNGKFKKGNPGGPGRPKGRSYATLYADALRDYAELNGKTPEEIENLIVKVALKKATEGDYQFYKDTMDRLHGKALQKTDITSDGKELPTPILGHVHTNNSTK